MALEFSGSESFSAYYTLAFSEGSLVVSSRVCSVLPTLGTSSGSVALAPSGTSALYVVRDAWSTTSNPGYMPSTPWTLWPLCFTKL